MKHIINLLVILVIQLNTYAQIKGQIINANTQAPIPDAIVILLDLNQISITDKNGNFYFDQAPKSNFTLQIKRLGYQTSIIQVNPDTIKENLKLYLIPSPISTDEVVITAFIPETQHNTTVKIENININHTVNSLPNVQFLLTQIAGLDLISKGIGIVMPTIRGLSKTNIVVLNEDFKLENFQFSENHPFFIDDYGINNIEIIKGSASIMYGSDAVGGVINVLWQQPAPNNKLYLDLNYKFHSNTIGQEISTSINFTKNNLTQFLNFSTIANADIIDGQKQIVPNTRFFKQNFKGYTLIRKKSWSSKILYQYTTAKLGLCIAPAIQLLNPPTHSLNDYIPKIYYQDLTHSFLGWKNNFIISKKSNLKLNLGLEQNRRGLRVKYDQPKPIDMFLQNLIYNIALTKNIDKLYLIIGSQGNLVKNKNIGKIQFLPNYKTINSSLFFINKLKLPKSNLLTGLRYDYAYIKPDTLPTKIYNNISATFGLTYSINKTNILRVNLASAFRNPNIAELAENGIHAFRYEIGNYNLKPQRNWAIDLSYHVHKPNIMLDFTAFYNKVFNFIYLAPTNKLIDSIPVYTYNQQNSEIYGVEFEAETKILNNLNSKLIATFQEGILQNGQTIPLFPQNKLKLFILYKFQVLSWSANFTINPVYAFAVNNPYPLEPQTKQYYLINAYFSMIKNTEHFEIQISISGYNLLNATYIDHLSSLRDVGYYDMGRNISLGLKLRFK